jgi:formamidopyrimidine-DNA glycosylase
VRQEAPALPELPEVETVRRGLIPVMEGRLIEAVAVNRPDLRWPFPERLAERLTGAQVGLLRRRSKYLLLDLSTAETLIVHLGMSGRLLVSGDAVAGFAHAVPDHRRHDHVVLGMEGGAVVTFNDARRFGMMDLAPTTTVEEHWLLRALGPEPLGNAFDGRYLARALRGRGTTIKAALMDQRIVAGLGNIYVCEALHMVGISPRRAAGRISEKRIDRLPPAIRATLEEAIAAGGSSLRDYRRTDGELGYFQHAFRVYGREGRPCLRSGCRGVVRRIVQSGRSTFYCPVCQR